MDKQTNRQEGRHIHNSQLLQKLRCWKTDMQTDGHLQTRSLTTKVTYNLQCREPKTQRDKQRVYKWWRCHTLLVSSGRTVSMAVCLINSSNSWTRTVRPFCIGLNSWYMWAKSRDIHTDNTPWPTFTHTHTHTHTHRQIQIQRQTQTHADCRQTDKLLLN